MKFIPCKVGSYILVYLAGSFATRDNFVYVQIVFGVLHGIGTGTGWTCCNVVSQQWLDKKRSQLNPYLLLGLVFISIFNPGLLHNYNQRRGSSCFDFIIASI